MFVYSFFIIYMTITLLICNCKHILSFIFAKKLFYLNYIFKCKFDQLFEIMNEITRIF